MIKVKDIELHNLPVRTMEDCSEKESNHQNYTIGRLLCWQGRDRKIVNKGKFSTRL